MCDWMHEGSDIEWPKCLKWTLPYYTFRFCLYQDYSCFDYTFQSEPRVFSFQMGIGILNGIHKKRFVLERFHRNTQIFGSVQFLTRVVKRGSVCDYSHQNIGFEAAGPLIVPMMSSLLWYYEPYRNEFGAQCGKERSIMHHPLPSHVTRVNTQCVVTHVRKCVWFTYHSSCKCANYMCPSISE